MSSVKELLPVSGKRHDPARKHRFRVIIPGFTHMGFAKVSGLKSTTGTTEYREGDEPPTPRKMLGLTKFDNIVLERGAGPDSDFRNWRREVFSVEGGLKDDDEVRRFVTIQLLNKKGGVAREWQIAEGVAVEDDHDDLDASSDDIEMEKLTIAHNGYVQTV